MGKCPRQESLPTLYTKILTVIAVEAPLLLDLGYASPPAAARSLVRDCYYEDFLQHNHRGHNDKQRQVRTSQLPTRAVMLRREAKWEAPATMQTRYFGLKFSVRIGVDVGDKYWGSVTRIEVVC